MFKKRYTKQQVSLVDCFSLQIFIYLVFSNQDLIRVERFRVEMSFIVYLEHRLKVLNPTSELSSMMRFGKISSSEKISFAVQNSQK